MRRSARSCPELKFWFLFRLNILETPPHPQNLGSSLTVPTRLGRNHFRHQIKPNQLIPPPRSNSQRNREHYNTTTKNDQQVVRTVQLEQLFPQTKDLPLEVVEGLLSALLTIRDPAAPRRPSSSSAQSRDVGAADGGGGGGGSSNSAPAGMVRSTSSGGGGVGVTGGGAGGGEAESMAAAAAAAASFEAHAVLALELSSRVVLANRHRVSSLWPALHSFLARWVGIGRGIAVFDPDGMAFDGSCIAALERPFVKRFVVFIAG